MSTAADFIKFFDSADVNKDGTLTLKELETVLVKNGYKTAQVKDMFRSVDASGDGLISKDEFLAAMGAAPPTTRKEARMRQLFNEFDLDGNGYIDKAELQRVFQAMNRILDDKESKRMVELMDAGGDGKVQYEEFIAFMFGK